MTIITIEEALQRASFCLKKAGIAQPREEAETLLAYLLKRDRLQLFLKRSEELEPEIYATFEEALHDRCNQKPLAYITGEKHFYGNRFKISKSVLIPRPETELIIDRALAWYKLQAAKGHTDLKGVDLGTGSGVLAVTMALKMPLLEVWAVDLSGEALKQARINAVGLGVLEKIKFFEGNYFSALRGAEPRPQFNLVASNPPYVSRQEMKRLPRGIKEYEPFDALCGGEDGLDSYRIILRELPEHISQPCLVLFEFGAGQKEPLEELVQTTGLFNTITWHCDLAGHPRVFEGEIRQAGLSTRQ